MADLIIVNGDVWAGVHGGHRAEALAIAGERIIGVGTCAQIRSLAGPKTRIIDARKRLVIPGLTDSHMHLIAGGFQLSRLNLREAKDKADFIRRVARHGKTVEPGQWILGGEWAVESWADPVSPDKSWVEPAGGDAPLYLTRMDLHQALANSVALKLAGIDAKGPPDPQGGVIERDPKTGEPTGILKDDAMELVSRYIPPPSDQKRYDALQAAMGYLNRYGITGVHDMPEPQDLKIYKRARVENALRLRVHGFLMVKDWSEHYDTLARYPRQDAWFRVAGFKGFMDGSLGSRTAFMREPYSDATADARYPRGLLVDQADPFEEFQEQIIQADAEGLQLAVHAIGDQANHLLLNAYASAIKANNRRDRRHRVEHAQHLLPSDVERFSRLGVIASMQPLHKADDGRYVGEWIGARRCRSSYAWKSLLDAGARVVFGSDWPVVSPNPFLGIEAAVTGRTLDGGLFVPAQNITVEEALMAYTSSAVYAAHCEQDLGTLEVGKLADVAILSQNVFEIPPEKLSDTRVDVTIVGGTVVWAADE